MPECILITGAAGYIGSQLMHRLSGEHAVVGIDIKLPVGSPANMLQCDIRDPMLAAIMREHQVSHVVHLASVLEASGDEQRDYDIDINGTRNVVESCLASGAHHLTVTSSGAAYGYHPDNPCWIDENDPLRGNDEFAYSRHKRLVEEYLQEIRQQQPQLHQLILRPGTVLGRHTRNQITHLFEKKRLLAIRGSSSPFVFIWDEDLIAIVERGIVESREGIYNLAGDGALTIDQVAASLQKPLLRLPAGLLHTALSLGHRLGLSRYRPEQINFLRYRPVLSNRRLKEEFGYQPQLSSAAVLELFIDHARARGQL
ncbi:SDR family oxidoreductase [Spongiibacter sp.]|uniref:SDR family oxidoreductase n=1 Tax=Spongiibacter sp. TaxID=2024860 RepID=UPI00356238CC